MHAYIQMCTCSQVCIYVGLWPEDVGAGGDVEGLVLDGHSGATKHTISDTELSPLSILCLPRTFFWDCKSTLICSCVSLFSTLWCVTGHASCQLWEQRLSTAASPSLNSSRSCWDVIEKKSTNSRILDSSKCYNREKDNFPKSLNLLPILIDLIR